MGRDLSKADGPSDAADKNRFGQNFRFFFSDRLEVDELKTVSMERKKVLASELESKNYDRHLCAVPKQSLFYHKPKLVTGDQLRIVVRCPS